LSRTPQREHALKIKAGTFWLGVRLEADILTQEKLLILTISKKDAGMVIGNDVTNEKRTGMLLETMLEMC
jgi:hypothetical protein